MEANKRCTENALKQALRKRQPGNLPSNFSYRMMGLVRLEAKKRRERKERVMLCGTIPNILLLIGMAVYTLVFKLEFSSKECLSGVDWPDTAPPTVVFYNYIATLALLLLRLNYWLRKRKFHS